ncbi:GAF domain-containing protein [Deinococcus deserti]|uniref:Putative GAF domain-containing protein n=1 Tax=Deinococcus deserti (strain DSM 17065 / CIP 109153 / LMG 22923 / VCD115) TaxID=546414 RepID=C1D3P3_DEIDV|nr:GAF domain-containing protein [Deinococcus deserti]ACO48122.1 putative GAF domain-containing protein [Deinococcus deserti VCD115]
MPSSITNAAVHEEQRLTLLERCRLMNTAQERSYDLIVEGLARLYGVPIALITFLDGQRQFIKANVGTDVREMPVTESLCQYTLESDSPLVLPDLTQDWRCHSHSLVTGDEELRFYAGAPIIVDGYRLGTVCIFDRVPHSANDLDASLLVHMAMMVAATIKARSENPRAPVSYPRYRAPQNEA